MRLRLLSAMLLITVVSSSRLCSMGTAVGPPRAILPVGPSTSPPGIRGPLPAITTVARAGRLTVWMVVGSARPVVGSKDGEHEMVQRLYGYDYSFRDIRAFDMKGRPVSPEKLPRLLERECQVVIAQTGSPIDAKHLRWLREDLLLLVVPKEPLAEWLATPRGNPVKPDAE